MPSSKSFFVFTILIGLLLCNCATLTDISSSVSDGSPLPPPATKTILLPSNTIMPTASQTLLENYFGLPYDPSVWTLIDSTQEYIPPSLVYVKDPNCSMAVNSVGADMFGYEMVDEDIQLGNHSWGRRYFLNNNKTIVFEVYFPDEEPAEYYSQLTEGNYHATGGYRLIGIYDDCRQVTQQLLAGMP